MNIKNLDKNLLKKLGLIFGIIIGIFLIIIIIKLVTGGKLEYTAIEDKMLTAAKKYYQENSNELPEVSGNTTTIETSKLVEKNYLKDLSKLVKNKNDNCSGSITVTNNNGYYLYSANLDCGDSYKTKKFNTMLTSNIVTSGDGLYNYNGTYIYRGETVNNYVSYAGKTWLILRINSDGSIRMLETTKRDTVVWDDRYNSSRQSNTGINDFNVSRIKDSINYIYQTEFTDNDKSYIFNQNLCIGKRNEADPGFDGTIECSNTVPNQPLGLLQVNEFSIASIDSGCKNITDPECTNYNYLVGLSSYWTLTADANNTYKVYKISGNPFSSTASSSSRIRLVVNINPNVNYVSGDGTSQNPYIFK